MSADKGRPPEAARSALEELRASPLFHHLPDAALENLAPQLLRKRYDKNQIIFQQGEVARGFFIILEGAVKLRVCSGSGKEQALHFFEAGGSFGEAAILGDGRYPADAVTLEPCRLVFVPAEPFLAEIRRDPEFSRQVLRSMAMRLMEFARIIENLSTREVKARLASYLISRQDSMGNSSHLELPVNKLELARLLGTTPESLSRALRSLAEEGIIRVEGRRILVIQPHLLVELSED